QELSAVGLILGIFCFAASLTPSLLPRHFVVQGALSGLAFAVGYGVGRLIVLGWQFFQIPLPGERLQRMFRWSSSVVAFVVAVLFLGQITRWQNSIRALMEMEPEASAYPFRVALIAVGSALVFIAFGVGVKMLVRIINRQFERVLPPRVSFVASTLL